MLEYIKLTLGLFFVLFALFIILMEIKVRVVGTFWEKPFKYTLVPIFLALDWVMNWLLSPVFMDLPAHPWEVVTGRMKRYRKLIYSPEFPIGFWNEFRFNFAEWLCRHLNRYDPGHC
jgi:hypothetical protein